MPYATAVQQDTSVGPRTTTHEPVNLVHTRSRTKATAQYAQQDTPATIRARFPWPAVKDISRLVAPRNARSAPQAICARTPLQPRVRRATNAHQGRGACDTRLNPERVVRRCNPSHRLEYCPPGTFGNTTAGRNIDHACTPCLPGFYCPIQGLTFATLRPCINGSYCPARSILPTACPAGYFNPEIGSTIVSACRVCPAGYFCPKNTSSFTENLCKPGYVCPAGSEVADRVPCPSGTYSNQTNLARISQCTNCTVGHYCPSGSANPVPCSPGTYNPLQRGVDAANCRDCDAGFACENWAMYTMTISCAPGHYCPPGTSSAVQHPCPPGYFSNFTNLTSVNQCSECPAGYASVSGVPRLTHIRCLKFPTCRPSLIDVSCASLAAGAGEAQSSLRKIAVQGTIARPERARRQ